MYGPCGICIEFASGQSLLLSDTDQLTLTVLNTACQWDEDSDEQDQLYNMGGTQGVGPDDVLVYYVNRIVKPDGGTLNGCAGHAPSRAAVAVSADRIAVDAGARTWARAARVEFCAGSRREREKLDVRADDGNYGEPAVPIGDRRSAAIRRSRYCVSC